MKMKSTNWTIRWKISDMNAINSAINSIISEKISKKSNDNVINTVKNSNEAMDSTIDRIQQDDHPRVRSGLMNIWINDRFLVHRWNPLNIYGKRIGRGSRRFLFFSPMVLAEISFSDDDYRVEKFRQKHAATVIQRGWRQHHRSHRHTSSVRHSYIHRWCKSILFLSRSLGIW